MIENILIVDTETTGLSPGKGDKVIEVAAIIYNVKYKSILQQFSTLLPCDANPVEHINQIKAEATQCNYPFVQRALDIENIMKNPNSPAAILIEETFLIDRILMEMSDAAQACVAHNAEFDKKFMATLPCGEHLLSKKWICTKQHFTWPMALSRIRLEDICNAMGVPYVNAHRALQDCILLAQCFSKIENLQERFNRC